MPVLSLIALAAAAIPALLFLTNLRRFRGLPPPDPNSLPEVSLLIPARDEAGNLPAALGSILASEGVRMEVVVLDDHSADDTAAIVRAAAAADSRVRLISGSPLPPGWCGKNFACHQLAGAARFPLLVFLDADVRLTSPHTLSGLAAAMKAGDLSLLSGVPRQITLTWMERLIIPLIQFVLLGFLPFRRMQAGTDPRFTAACGQVLAVRKAPLEAAGGYGAVSGRIHDAMALAKLLRSKGCRTDVADLTRFAVCRMYDRAGAVWQGFAKNAHEGLGAPGRIVPVTLLLFAGQVLPFVLLAFDPSLMTVTAAGLSLLPRLAGVVRWRQSPAGALFHAAGIFLLMATQWHGLFRHLRGRPVVWKGRPGALLR